MRLESIKKKAPLGLRVGARVAKALGGVDIPDVAFVMNYRREIFGERFSAWIHALLRGESGWSVGERELFASFTAQQLQCEF